MLEARALADVPARRDGRLSRVLRSFWGLRPKE